MTVSLLVNGRTPSPPSFCALCCEPISESYLKEVATRLCYCGYGCYRDHCDNAGQAFENYAKALTSLKVHLSESREVSVERSGYWPSPNTFLNRNRS